MFCIPVMAEIHEGVEKLRAFQGKQPPVVEGEEKVTNVTLMLSLADSLTRHLTRPCMLILDAYFAVGPTFLIAKECVDHCGQRLLHVITRAKDNAVGYTGPPPTKQQGKRGRSPFWGREVKLWKSRSKDFQTLTLSLYGKEVTLSYLCLDLLWKPIKENFVLVMDGTEKFVLMCSNLSSGDYFGLQLPFQDL